MGKNTYIYTSRDSKTVLISHNIVFFSDTTVENIIEALNEFDMALRDLEKAHSLAKDDSEVLAALVKMRKRVQADQKAVDDMWRGKITLKPQVAKPNNNNNNGSLNSITAILWGWIAWVVSFLSSLIGRKPAIKDQ